MAKILKKQASNQVLARSKEPAEKQKQEHAKLVKELAQKKREWFSISRQVKRGYEVARV